METRTATTRRKAGDGEGERPAVERAPRGEGVQRLLLDATFAEVARLGFRAVTVEAIAVKTGVAKTTIYRRWPNKAALVMDAFLARIAPEIPFPSEGDALAGVLAQMLALARAFGGEFGAMIRALLGEAQFDPDLGRAFHERWIAPRREVAKDALKRALESGEVRPDIDLDATLDALYGGLYYRLMTNSGELSPAYVESLFAHVVDGLRRRAETRREEVSR